MRLETSLLFHLRLQLASYLIFGAQSLANVKLGQNAVLCITSTRLIHC